MFHNGCALFLSNFVAHLDDDDGGVDDVVVLEEAFTSKTVPFILGCRKNERPLHCLLEKELVSASI